MVFKFIDSCYRHDSSFWQGLMVQKYIHGIDQDSWNTHGLMVQTWTHDITRDSWYRNGVVIYIDGLVVLTTPMALILTHYILLILLHHILGLSVFCIQNFCITLLLSSKLFFFKTFIRQNGKKHKGLWPQSLGP